MHAISGSRDVRAWFRSSAAGQGETRHFGQVVASHMSGSNGTASGACCRHARGLRAVPRGGIAEPEVLFTREVEFIASNTDRSFRARLSGCCQR